MSTISYNGYSYILPPVNSKYRINIDLPFHYTERANNTLGVWDDGSAYDIRRCTFDILADNDEMLNLYQMWDDIGRQNTITLTTTSNDNFYPFGPDYPVGEYIIDIIDFKQGKQLLKPYRYYKVTMNIVMQSGPARDTSFSESCEEIGNLQLGLVDDIRDPEGLASTEIVYFTHRTLTRGGNLYVIDPLTSDYYETTLDIKASRKRTAEILDYLLYKKRTQPFLLNVPSRMYIFGRENLDSSGYLVQLNQEKIEISHDGFRDWNFKLTFRLVSG